MISQIENTQKEREAVELECLNRFREANPDFFQKNDLRLFLHLGKVAALLILFTFFAVVLNFIPAKMIFGALSALCWFALINVTIHHHHTHHNAANSPAGWRILNLLYFLAVPNATKRKSRYVRAHLNHHARPFHETDLDHHYGRDRYLKMNGNHSTKRSLHMALIYYLSLRGFTIIIGTVDGKMYW